MSVKTNVDLLTELNKKVFDVLERLYDDEMHVASTDAVNYMEKKEGATEESYRYHRTRADAFACAKNAVSQIIVEYIRSLR